ncbi:MAG TPA: isoprenylcysteine carboxylmethyltransferase family protein [Terriglobales bacterium]|jgi:protein-S-isoprenylcysteine O-methyltransferase Ste14|nr:isoprenylcysteine carboxylmethyltransferase family protein [Terriglobales bacterium]
MADLKFYLFLGVQGVSVLVLLVFVAVWPRPWNGQRLAGSVLLLIGMSLVFSARLQLGRSFSLTPQARKLVTHGLYSRIRNPIYVFGTLAIVGLCLILQRPALWLLPLFVIVMQTARARREAQVLEAKFGDEYRAYRAGTWF